MTLVVQTKAENFAREKIFSLADADRREVKELTTKLAIIAKILYFSRQLLSWTKESFLGQKC